MVLKRAVLTLAFLLAFVASAAAQNFSLGVWQVNFGGVAQPVSQSGTWSISFSSPQHIVCDSGCGGAASFTDNGAFTFGTTAVNNAGYVVDDVGTNAVTENSSGAPRMTTARIPYADISKSASNTNSFKVDFGGAAQPVSLAALPSLVAGSAVIGHVIVDTTSTTAVTQATGTNLHAVVDSGTITTVSAVTAITNALPAGAALLGKVGIDQTTPGTTNRVDVGVFPDNEPFNVAQFGGTNVSTGTGASGTGIPRVTVANDSNVIVTPPTLTKATQGSTGFSTQDLKDAGRTAISFSANNVASGTTTTETLITLTQSKGTAATSSVTTYTITSGKTLRLTALSVGSRGHATATIQSTVFNLRLNTGGACLVGSTPILFAAQSATAAVASAWDRVIIPIPDGYEIAGNGTIAICISAAATFTTNAPTWSVNLIGYEY